MFQYSGLDKEGYIFYPNQCIEENTSCKVHVHVHGCAALVRQAGMEPVTNSGFNEWAVTNDIIVLHP